MHSLQEFLLFAACSNRLVQEKGLFLCSSNCLTNALFHAVIVRTVCLWAGVIDEINSINDRVKLELVGDAGNSTSENCCAYFTQTSTCLQWTSFLDASFH